MDSHKSLGDFKPREALLTEVQRCAEFKRGKYPLCTRSMSSQDVHLEGLICFSRSQNHKYEVQKKKRVGKYEIQKGWPKERESERETERDTHAHRYGWDPPKGVSTMRCLQRLYAALTEDQDAGEAQGLS